MLADTVGNARKLSLGPFAIDDDMAEPVAERDEVAFRIDDDLLDPLRGLFKQASQQMRLAGAGIALDEKTGRQKLLDIERRRGVP